MPDNSSPQWYKPVDTTNVTAVYGQRPRNPKTTWRAYGAHTGVDYGVKTGSPVYAVANAKVIKAGFDEGVGNYVTIGLGNGRRISYQHLSSVGVKPGQRLTGGYKLGLSGNTGSLSQGAHLHTEYMVNGKIVSPENFYGGKAPKWAKQAAGAASVLGAGFSFAGGAPKNANLAKNQPKLPKNAAVADSVSASPQFSGASLAGKVF